MRHVDGLNVESLKNSLDPVIEKNIEAIRKAGEGMGKSGSFFFFSHDGEFLIKTMTLGDFKAFTKLFRYYFEHINTEKNSLLARIYGIYSVQMDDQDPVYLILMGSSVKCDNNYIKHKFDLKGSLVKREEKSPNIKNTTILKDKNILAIKKVDKCLQFQNSQIPGIMKQLGRDIVLLSHFNLMDYSLLFVIEYNPVYVKKYPSEFAHNSEGKLILPVRETNCAKGKDCPKKNSKMSDAIAKKNITDDFMSKLCGISQVQFEF